jgi:hypothetical protein
MRKRANLSVLLLLKANQVQIWFVENDNVCHENTSAILVSFVFQRTNAILFPIPKIVSATPPNRRL